MSIQTGIGRLYDRMAPNRHRDHPQSALLEALHGHVGLMIQTAGRVLGDLTEAEDVVQDIAEKLLRSPPREVRSWPALLKTMATHAAIDRLRRRRDWTDLEPPGTSESPESVLTDEQRAEVLREAIAGLSERDAELFSLHYFGDLSLPEIADRLAMSTNAATVAMHRVRQRLAARVRDRLGIEPSNGESP